MEFIPHDYYNGKKDGYIPMLPPEERTMKEPASCMDRLYNSLNSYRDEFPPPRSVWHIFAASEPARTGQCLNWVQLDQFVREQFVCLAFPIRGGAISDDALLNMIDAAWQNTTEAPLIKDVFGGTVLPANLRTGFEAWSDIYKGLVKDAPYPIPSYDLFPEETRQDNFSKFEEFVQDHRVALQIPALNIEQLTNRENLLMLIVQRTLKTPPYFSLADWEAMHIGRAGRLLPAPFCDGTFMTFLRGRDPNQDWYETTDKLECQYVWDGRPSIWRMKSREHPLIRLSHAAHGHVLETDGSRGQVDEWKSDLNLTLNQRGVVYGWGEGLLVLQAQSAIYRFCLELCRLAEKIHMEAEPLMIPVLPGWPENKAGSWKKQEVTGLRNRMFRLKSNVAEDEYEGMSWMPEAPRAGEDLRIQDASATYTREEIRVWREASDERIRAVADTWPYRVGDHELPEGQFQYGFRPTAKPYDKYYEKKSDEGKLGCARCPPRGSYPAYCDRCLDRIITPRTDHYRTLEFRCGALHAYFKRRTELFLTSPAEFVAMCRDGYNCHYGWIRDGAGGSENSQDLLEHMVSTDFNAKKAIANDVIRRCLRFLVFATEISYALTELIQLLGIRVRPTGPDFHIGMDGPEFGYADIGKDRGGYPTRKDIIHHPLSRQESRDAYLACVLHLRWFNEVLFTHLHGQAIVHGSKGCRSLCDRDHVPKERLLEQEENRFDKHGNLRYNSLPMGLKGLNPPPVPKYNPGRLSVESTVSADEIGKLLKDVERGPPNAEYGIPSMKSVAGSILTRIETLSTMEDQDELLGSTSLVRDAAFIVSQLADILTEMEVVDPLRSERHILNDPTMIERYKLFCESNRVLEALDDFNFESTIQADGLRPVYELLGVCYSSDDTKISNESAKQRLDQFRTHIFKFFEKRGCSKHVPLIQEPSIHVPGQPKPIVHEPGTLESMKYVSDYWREKTFEYENILTARAKEMGREGYEPEERIRRMDEDMGIVLPDVQPVLTETFQVTNIFGTITTKDPEAKPAALVEPPSLTGFKISDEPAIISGSITVKDPDSEAIDVPPPTPEDSKTQQIAQRAKKTKESWEAGKAFTLGYAVDLADEEEGDGEDQEGKKRRKRKKYWKSVKVPEKYKNPLPVEGPRPQDRLDNRDWATVDDTFGKGARKKGSIRWWHWEKLFKHMGFEVTPTTGGSACKFEWTPASKIPEPAKKTSSVHMQHANSASIEPFRVRDWCSKFTDDFGITAEVIEEAYGRYKKPGVAGPHAMMARVMFGPFDMEEDVERSEEWDELDEDEDGEELEKSDSGDSSSQGSRKRKAVDELDDLFEREMRRPADGGRMRRFAHPKKVRFA